MSEPFIAEVKMVGFNFAPRGWAFCDGQILPINQNQSLYSLLGTTYGGDGRVDFALPDLRGRTPIHVGSSNGGSHSLGQKSGQEVVTLSAAQMPQHDHQAQASDDNASTGEPGGKVLARSTSPTYHSPTNMTEMHPLSVLNAGGGQAHQNMMPYLAVNFCIALTGLFPSRN